MFGKKIVLILILLLGIIVRIVNLSQVPPGIHADEADTGYSAYSILKTGKTQYGDFNPLAFREFNGGTHPPVYTYFLMPLVALFGLNIVVERLPSVIFGILLIPLFYFLGKKLFKSDSVGLIASALLAVNPWAIHVSRQGLLQSVALFFVVLGITLFLYAKEKKWFYILSAISFGISLHAYDATKVVLPLFIPALIYYEWDSLKKLKKQMMIFLLVFSFFYLMMLKVVFVDGQIGDYSQVSSFDIATISSTADSERKISNAPIWLSSLFHNKGTVFVKNFLTNYFNVFSINWFFINGDGNTQRAVTRHGEFHLFELPFFFIGIYFLFRYKRRVALLLIYLMLLSAIPAAITTGNFPYRGILLLPVPILFSSIGIYVVWGYLSSFNLRLRLTIKVVLIIVFIAYVMSYLFTYFFDYPKYASESWYRQRNDVIFYLENQYPKSKKIYIYGGIEWAILYAFQTKLPPREFQQAFLNSDKYKATEKVMKLRNVFIGSYPLKNISSPSKYFPSGSVLVVDYNFFPEARPVKTFSAVDPLNVVYKIIEVK